MILEQHYLACLSQASYLIVDRETRSALVVDPRRDVELYLERARELGARIEHVALTHFHADFLAGHLELRSQTGARLWMGAEAEAEYEFEPLRDGAEIELGHVLVTAIETPGHTPESICLLARDRSDSSPGALMTGDTLFVGDVGRPDLMASVGISAEDLAGRLYDSLHEKLLRLPDETVVWPGHGAGSACGRSLSSDSSSTIGRERRENPALRAMPKEEFVADLSSSQALAPAYFARAAALNKRERAGLDQSLQRAMFPLSLDELRIAAADGAQILDVRSKDAYAAEHLDGSVWIGLEGRFASWAGTLLDLERDVILVAEKGQEREAALRLMRVGIDQVRGYLDGSVQAWSQAQLRTVPRVDVLSLSRVSAASVDAFVLDVRTAAEWREGHVAGSLNLPLAEIGKGVHELPSAKSIYVHCKSGYRSLVAHSLLAGKVTAEVVDVEDGFDSWRATGLPIEILADSSTQA